MNQDTRAIIFYVPSITDNYTFLNSKQIGINIIVPPFHQKGWYLKISLHDTRYEEVTITNYETCHGYPLADSFIAKICDNKEQIEDDEKKGNNSYKHSCKTLWYCHAAMQLITS